MPSSVEFDEQMMKRALALARRARGQTSPNPMVGAIVAKNRRLIAEGYHHRAGTPHAEVHALKAAGDRAKGADLYVTLEPCCTHGRTPPCTDAIIGAGIRRVIVATTDPNPRHAGRGLDLLKEAGIKVEVGLLAEEASRLNEGFNKWICYGTPFVIAKAAMSLDGKIATAVGKSKWITGEAARALVQELRCGVDAIMVGWRTVALDDPRLTVRLRGVTHQPCRVVVDARGEAPLTATVFTDDHHARTMALTSKQAPVAWRKQLAGRGVTMIECAMQGERLDLADAFKKLGERDVTSVLVEGGGRLLGALMDQRLVDKLVFFYAPKIIGGREAPTAIEGEGIRALADAIALHNVEWRRVGDDLVVTAYC
jgi:diaminohydroxyphosphoribosylaminopyrimidine deaminase / 5-amino-6-(5-phosphoribosylamino)uracil reductase